jgi:hypothetical protein
MPNKSVRSGADHFLPGGDLNGSSGITVLSENAKNNVKPECHDGIGNQAHDRRHIRPVKTKIQTGNDEQANEKEAGKTLDKLLSP